MFQNLSINKGIIRLNDCDFDINDKLENLYHNSLKEDLLQIEFDNSYLIDVGWYPEFDKNGKFIILLVKNNDWDNPIKEIKTRDLKELDEIVRFLIKENNKL